MICLCRHNEPRQQYSHWRGEMFSWNMGSGWDSQSHRDGLYFSECVWFLGIRSNMFDRGTNSGGLFAEYVNMFLKLKQESSGYPSWVQRQAEKKYGRAEGIALDKAWNSKNAGVKTLAKIKLNSMCGKWAQNQNKTHTTLVTSVKVIRASDKSGYCCYNPHIPDWWRGICILEKFGGLHGRREKR